MKILVTNDDGITADGLWILVRELTSIAEVVVVAPDREQSASGTAVTLWEPLRTRKVNPPVAGVEAYAVEGTPSDSVLLALGSLVKSGVDLVISGINWGLNLGDDIYISGTVSAALQGYLHGHPALAVSTERDSELGYQTAASLAAILAGKIKASPLPANLFLNINVPNVPLPEIGRIQVTRLAWPMKATSTPSPRGMTVSGITTGWCGSDRTAGRKVKRTSGPWTTAIYLLLRFSQTFLPRHCPRC